MYNNFRGVLLIFTVALMVVYVITLGLFYADLHTKITHHLSLGWLVAILTK